MKPSPSLPRVPVRRSLAEWARANKLSLTEAYTRFPGPRNPERLLRLEELERGLGDLTRPPADPSWVAPASRDASETPASEQGHGGLPVASPTPDPNPIEAPPCDHEDRLKSFEARLQGVNETLQGVTQALEGAAEDLKKSFADTLKNRDEKLDSTIQVAGDAAISAKSANEGVARLANELKPIPIQVKQLAGGIAELGTQMASNAAGMESRAAGIGSRLDAAISGVMASVKGFSTDIESLKLQVNPLSSSPERLEKLELIMKTFESERTQDADHYRGWIDRVRESQNSKNRGQLSCTEEGWVRGNNALTEAGLFFDEKPLRACVNTLERQLVLYVTGPVGMAKTELVMRLMAFFTDKWEGAWLRERDYLEAKGTWTTHHSLGYTRPLPNGADRFVPGFITRAVLDAVDAPQDEPRFLVIDEVTRCPPTELFGGLLQVLGAFPGRESASFTLEDLLDESESACRVRIPSNFRLIIISNPADDRHLHPLPEAEKRRLNPVVISAPSFQLQSNIVRHLLSKLSEPKPTNEQFSAWLTLIEHIRAKATEHEAHRWIVSADFVTKCVNKCQDENAENLTLFLDESLAKELANHFDSLTMSEGLLEQLLQNQVVWKQFTLSRKFVADTRNRQAIL